MSNAKDERIKRAAWAKYVADTCTCNWPNQVFRNMPGHRSDCTVHAEFLTRWEEDLDRKAKR